MKIIVTVKNVTKIAEEIVLHVDNKEVKEKFSVSCYIRTSDEAWMEIYFNNPKVMESAQEYIAQAIDYAIDTSKNVIHISLNKCLKKLGENNKKTF